MCFILGMMLALILNTGNVFAADYMNYDSTYKNIKVGSSTERSLKHFHGKPLRTLEKDKYTLFRYRKFDAAVNKHDGKVRSIIIFDRSYKDRNYLKIGDSRKKVERALKKDVNGDNAIDRVHGIVYWFDGNRIEKIVLANRLHR
ncbi:hypothetical protein [Enterovibrio nigricans]|uniref:Uncharacterized protein n=1 Tax=Enterovibrio nigricans DSM 22720 TaxID=1121868 RepID=A0A1T4UIL1_9GAMM|nr:hypothetical protein [Enterovibrio nigricans]PKF51228.1 hypothetical protein AT251_05390 [Enterovibrio nigricans]SKA52622.1 hypothetical protein SAMN02745132_01841 [Enterovibrio nigricans DSM 22720]